MPVHDWTRVDAGIFHAFYLSWLARLQDALNSGIMPEGFYALAEQHAGRLIPDILTLHAGRPTVETPIAADTGGTLVAEAPPKMRRKHSVIPATRTRRRSLAIRHVSGHRLVALLEIVSPANKGRGRSVVDFVGKAASALEHGIHFQMIDLLPPGRHDLQGMHAAILQELEDANASYALPADEPLTLASYVAGETIDMYLEHLGVGTALVDMPLFFLPDRYVDVPLETTYQEAYHGLPAIWRSVLEA